MKRVLSCSLSSAGAALAAQLPFEHRRGDLVGTVRQVWHDVDGLVLFCAAGIAVRAVAPLLDDQAGAKTRSPGVVCVDDCGRWVVALIGGHAADANALARQVASLLGAEAVVTTATDGAGVPGLDTLPGYRAHGDLAGVTRRWLDGHPPAVSAGPGLESWPLPAALVSALSITGPGAGSPEGGRVTVTDSSRPAATGEVLLRPASLVLGVGASTGADPGRLSHLVSDALAAGDLHRDAVGLVATADRKAGEPAIVSLAASYGVPLRTFPAAALAEIDVPHPSAVVAAAVGTPSVAEAAALAASAPEGHLVVTKQASEEATVAVARRRRPAGHLAVVGLGPGDPRLRTIAATAAVRHGATVMGYGPYLDLAADLVSAHQEVVRSPIGAESGRCREALRRAANGESVVLVCSGDAGVYAMASLVLELAPSFGDPPVTVVPGVTAALAAAAVLGAPLGHDHAAISLSDLMTPWVTIRARLVAAAAGDFAVSLYNPRSQRRTTQLVEALSILSAHRPPGTPAAIVTEAGRPGQRVVRTTLDQLEPGQVGMLSLVVVGSSTTRWIGDRMVTPRGYRS